MGIAASELCRYVIRPTLIYLGRHEPRPLNPCCWVSRPASRNWVPPCTTVAATASTASPNPRHRALWDTYLALDPERASLVRGLASQHAFLSAPAAWS